ncbi:MAG TPA: hypothetical protein VMY15_06580 [Candidatus Latescibacteria bacterium]|nr:hypothetical protein [Candidatus Latescibacterota bacterium]
MKRFALSVVILGVLSLIVLPGCKIMSNEELRSSIEVQDFESKWVSTFYQGWPMRLKLAPQISFRVKNISAKPLNYVNFITTYVSKADQMNLGSGLLAAIRGKALAPGELSDKITMTCDVSVEGKNKKDFETNPGWESYEVKLFVQSKGSQHVLLGIFDISRNIDFKEDAPVGPKPGEVKK